MTDERDTSWHPRFIAALQESCNVSAAARAAGVARSTAHRHREEFPAFAAEWDDAIEQGVDELELEARRRAKDGVEKPVFHQGVECGRVREYSDTLMIFLLKAHRPDKYRERRDLKVSGTLSIAELMEKAGAGE